jgi:hypothetical protein
MAGGRGDDLARAQPTKRSATQCSAAPCASSGPVRQAGPSVAYPRRTPGPAIPGHGKGRLREHRRRSRPGRVARGMEARQGRDAGSNCIPRRLDAKHDSPAPRSGGAPTSCRKPPSAATSKPSIRCADEAARSVSEVRRSLRTLTPTARSPRFRSGSGPDRARTPSGWGPSRQCAAPARRQSARQRGRAGQSPHRAEFPR